MPESKHTPGPWRVDPTDRHEVLTSDSRFRILQTNRGGAPLAEWEANARLIAAAPDLLASLRELHDILRNGMTGRYDYMVASLGRARELMEQVQKGEGQ